MRGVIAGLAMLGLAGCGGSAQLGIWDLPAALVASIFDSAPAKEPPQVVKHDGANCRTNDGSEYKFRDRDICARNNGVWIGE